MTAHLLKLSVPRSYAIVLVLLAAACQTAAAQSDPGFYDGKRLYAACNRSGAAERAECAGYIMGIVDALADRGSIHGYESCSIRKNATEAEIVDFVKGSLADRLQLLDNEASMLVASALSWKFACPTPPRADPPPCCVRNPGNPGRQ
jgi:hypothetical protein